MDQKQGAILNEIVKKFGFKNEIKWSNVILIILYHMLAVYWCYHFTFPVKWQTVVFAMAMYIASGFGITGGAHRLWSHKAYKAKLPLRLFLLMCFSSAGQNSLFQWVRDHRVHHKYSDTDADPHNASRGLFFSHIGWLMVKRNSQVRLRCRQTDMSDIMEDPVIRFYERHFIKLTLLFCYMLPLAINVWLLGENWKCVVAWQWFIRFLSTLHVELTVNSLAHSYGYQPYNKDIMARENRFVTICTFGEGSHNYHHAFPFDYKGVEHLDTFNLTTYFIRVFEKIGWAYDFKEATPEMINSITMRLGDATPVHFPIPVNTENQKSEVKI